MGEAIRDEIITILEGELGDPRIGLVSVTEVQMSPDGRSARIFVNVEGDEDEALRTMEGLLNARSYIRRELGSNLRLRQAPELHFHLDRSNVYSSRIEELLSRIKKKRR